MAMLFYELSVGMWAFVIGLSQISFIFSSLYTYDISSEKPIHILYTGNNSPPFYFRPLT